MYKDLFKILNIIQLMTIVIIVGVSLFWMTKLVLLVDFDWVTDSYFIISSKFNWVKFLTQFIIIDLIFVLPLLTLDYIYYSLNAEIKKKYAKLVEISNALYVSFATVITLSLTANELVFTFITSTIAFIALVIPIFKLVFKQRK